MADPVVALVDVVQVVVFTPPAAVHAGTQDGTVHEELAAQEEPDTARAKQRTSDLSMEKPPLTYP